MLALYRTGRQAEALEVYREARHTLTDELGIVPGPELQRLEEAILRQDPVLEPPSEVPTEPAVPVQPAPPPTETRKTVTVLVAARSPHAGIDPEALHRLDVRYLETATRVIQRHGGRIDSVLGDRVLAVFGVPLLHEDDALRAVRAALELTASQAGLATGEVLMRETESAGFSVSGEPVARAGELADAAATGEILLADETYELLGDAARAEPLGNGDRPTWRLLELIPRPPPLSRPPESPILGRQGELDQLRAALDRADRERTVHLFTVLGPPGIGKTRLAEEFASQVARDATVVAGRCVPYGEGITFWPMREIVGWLTAARPLSELLAGEERAAHIAERITEAIGQTHATSSVEELFWAFRRLIEATARERRLLVVLEDLHWAEPTLLDLVEYLAERVRDAPSLLLCLARPELLEKRPAWGGGKRNASSLFLDRLSAADSRELIGTLAAGLPEATRARVHETAEGNPLFLEQILAMLAEDGAVDGGIPIPPTIQAVLAARLDRLGPGERAVIERAAVVGKEFVGDAIEHQLPQDARRFASRHLDALVRKELLHPVRSLMPGQEAFRFRHVLIQQATYRGIPKHLRATLHEQVAAWLEHSLGGDSAEYAETAGFHLEQTYRYRSELSTVGDEDRALAAARRSCSPPQGRGPSAAATCRRRSTCSGVRSRCSRGMSGARTSSSLPDLGSRGLFEIGELRRADEVLAQAISRARTRGDRAIEWNAVVKLGNVRMYTEPEAMDAESLIRNASEAITALEELGDDLGLARAWSLLSEARWITGQMTDASLASAQGAEHARHAGSPREEAWGLGAYAMALLYGPMPEAEATRATEQLLKKAGGNLVLEANLAGFLAAHLAMTGRFDEARANIQKSCERLTDLGLKWQVGVQQLLGGYIELLGSDPVASERYMRSARDSFIEIGDRWFTLTVAADLPRPGTSRGATKRRSPWSRRSPRCPPPQMPSGRPSAAVSMRGCSPGTGGSRRPSAWRAREWPLGPRPTSCGSAPMRRSISRTCCGSGADSRRPPAPPRTGFDSTSGRASSPRRLAHES